MRRSREQFFRAGASAARPAYRDTPYAEFSNYNPDRLSDIDITDIVNRFLTIFYAGHADSSYPLKQEPINGKAKYWALICDADSYAAETFSKYIANNFALGHFDHDTGGVKPIEAVETTKGLSLALTKRHIAHMNFILDIQTMLERLGIAAADYTLSVAKIGFIRIHFHQNQEKNIDLLNDTADDMKPDSDFIINRDQFTAINRQAAAEFTQVDQAYINFCTRLATRNGVNEAAFKRLDAETDGFECPINYTVRRIPATLDTNPKYVYDFTALQDHLRASAAPTCPTTSKPIYSTSIKPLSRDDLYDYFEELGRALKSLETTPRC